MNKDNAKRIEVLEKQVEALKKAFAQTDNRERVVEMQLILPEADIGGLHFNKQKVVAVFEKQKDGWYYSRDILFLSARNVKVTGGIGLPIPMLVLRPFSVLVATLVLPTPLMRLLLVAAPPFSISRSGQSGFPPSLWGGSKGSE